MKKDKHMNSEAEKIISWLGGPRAICLAYNIVDKKTGRTKDSRVSMWKTNGIPDTWMMIFERDHPHLVKKARKYEKTDK